MLVIVLLLCMLCLGHHFTSLFNQLSDLVSKIYEGISPEVPRARSMGSFASALCTNIKDMWPVLTLTVVLIASSTYGSLVNQVLCSSSNKSAQYLLDCSMLVFSLSIALWMVSSGMKCFCTQEFPKRFPELCHKMWVSVTYNCLGNSKASHHMCKEQLRCYLSCS